MQTPVMDEIEAINKAVADRIGQQKYRVWFHNSTQMSISDGYLKVGVPNIFIGSWIENHFMDELAQSVQQVVGHDLNITINIDPELSGRQRRTQLDSQARLVTREHNKTLRGRVKTPTVKRSLKLDLDSFVVGSGNQLAYNAARAVIREEKSPYNPLFLHGGYGLGKTHLLQGICNEHNKKTDSSRWMYVSAEDFTNQFMLALKTRKLEQFRERFRKLDLLAIDDIHFLASKPSTQEEFLHTFNAIDLAGKQIVLASDAHPKMIGKLCDKLVNRFVSGMVIKVELPDLNARLEICKKKLESMSKTFPADVVKYVAENMKTNVRELEGALLKLVAFSSLNKEKISLSMARKLLSEHISRTDPIVHISDIESAVANYFAVTPADVHSSRKDRTVSLARSFSMFLARKYTEMSFPEIGRLMGNKNHATVILACRKIEDYTSKNTEVSWKTPAGNRLAKAKDILSKLETTIGK